MEAKRIENERKSAEGRWCGPWELNVEIQRRRETRLRSSGAGVGSRLMGTEAGKRPCPQEHVPGHD